MRYFITMQDGQARRLIAIAKSSWSVVGYSLACARILRVKEKTELWTQSRKRRRRSGSEASSGGPCGVCYESTNTRTLCGHVVCDVCISKWNKNAKWNLLKKTIHILIESTFDLIIIL